MVMFTKANSLPDSQKFISIYSLVKIVLFTREIPFVVTAKQVAV